MGGKLLKLIFVAFLIKAGQNRELWAPAVPEISPAALDKELKNTSNQIQIVDLNGTLYSHSFSHLRPVKELRILRNQIREIESGALCSAPNIKILELDLSANRKPPSIQKNMFDNCDLDELFLKFDYSNPSGIDRDALENLPNLRTLGIDSLRIERLKKNFLELKNNTLRKLILSNVHVSKIDPDVFDGLNNLEEIEIVHNLELVRLPLGVFKRDNKVKRLGLRDNALKNLTWDEFEGLSSLEELDVVDNQIEFFDAAKIAKNMPKLKKLMLEINPVPCNYLPNFKNQLNAKYNRVIEIPDRYPNLYDSC